MPVLYLIGGLVLLGVGYLLGRIAGRPGASPSEAGEPDRLRRRVLELSDALHASREELGRKHELSAMVPSLVRTLSEKLHPDDIPAIVVRFMKDCFRCSRIGFFGPVEGGSALSLVEGAGFPREWKGEVRIPSDRGMVGMALRHNAAVTREEYVKSLEGREIGSSPLEQLVGVADLVVPVPPASGTYGVIVLEGCPPGRLDGSYAAMLADLLGSSLHRAQILFSVEAEANTDPLTRLYNRRHFAEWFESEIRQAKNYSQPLSLILFDVDHFKTVNDRYGHPVGDLVLQMLAVAIRGTTRRCNLVARYGGEEFAVIMVSASEEQAFLYADNLRQDLASLEIPIPGRKDTVRITISGGIAAYPADGTTTADLIHAADEALYAAKRGGRNRICVSRRP